MRLEIHNSVTYADIVAAMQGAGAGYAQAAQYLPSHVADLMVILPSGRPRHADSPATCTTALTWCLQDKPHKSKSGMTIVSLLVGGREIDRILHSAA